MSLQVTIAVSDHTPYDTSDRRKYLRQDIAVEDTMDAAKRVEACMEELSAKLPPEDMLYIDAKQLGVVYVGFRHVTDLVDASMLMSHAMAAAYGTSQVTVS